MSWSIFYDQALTLASSQAVGDNVLTLDGLTGNQILVQVSSPTSAPRWRLALRVLFLHQLLDFPPGAIVAESYGRKVLLNKPCLIEAPLSITAPYSIKLLIPYWHKQINLKIWQREQVLT